MNGKQLKNSILQWAIQGKLVPQDPNDEPASVLLEKIRAEKERLVKEKLIKKSSIKEVPITNDEKLFEIPDTWTWCKLGWVGDWGAGATPAKGNPEFYNNGTIPWLRTGELNNGYVFDSEIKITKKALETCSLRMCKKDDVLIAMYGATIGKVAIAGIELTTNQACCACTPYLIDNKYLLYYLLANKKTFIELGEGGAQPNISREKIIAFPFALPPLAEQHRIVAKIEELMPLVEKYGEIQEALEEWNNSLPEKLKKSILQESIQGKLVPQDPNEGIAEISNSYKVPRKTSNFDDYLFEIPEKWKWCKLFQIADVIGGYAFQSGDLKSNNGIRVIRISDITPKGLSNKSVVRCSLREIPDQYSIKCNDILIAMTGGTVGKSLLLKSMTEPMYLNQRVAIIRASKDVDVEYLNLVIKSPLIQSIISDVKNSTNDNISMADITGFPFPLPPLAEQRRIVEKIEELFGVIKK